MYIVDIPSRKVWHPVDGWTTPSRTNLERYLFTDHDALWLCNALLKQYPNATCLTGEEVRDTLGL